MKRIVGVVWPFVLVLLLWQAWITLAAVPQIVAPAPLAAFVSALKHAPQFLPDVLATLSLIAVGLGLGMLLGIVLASAAWFSPLLSGVLTPATVLLNAMPSVALLPIVASIIGFNDGAVVAMATLITFFPAFVLTRSGLDATPVGSPGTELEFAL